MANVKCFCTWLSSKRLKSALVLPIGLEGTVLLIEEYDLDAETWQLTIQGEKRLILHLMVYSSKQREMREKIAYRPGRLEKWLDFSSHPGYIGHKVHLMVAYDLVWESLEMEDGEEIRVKTFTPDEVLIATKMDYRCDPEATLVLWLYASGKLF